MSGFGHCQAAIPDRNGSVGLLSLAEDVDTAVVFVHGFLGDATSTWEHFPYLIDICAGEYPWWNETDAFFYKYRGSHRIPIAVHAEEFLRFLAGIFPFPDERLFIPSSASLERLRPLGFRYRKLVLVGHSEGAVVIRRAVAAKYKLVRETRPEGPRGTSGDYARISAELRAGQEQFLQANPDLDATVILFAPAHLGASLTGWPGLLLGYFRAVRLLQPLIDSLTGYDDLKKDSPVLSQLQRDTESFATESSFCRAFRAQSYFGEKDRVVYISEYTTDPKAVIAAGHGHTSICKPTLNYKEPLSYVSSDQGRTRSAP